MDRTSHQEPLSKEERTTWGSFSRTHTFPENSSFCTWMDGWIEEWIPRSSHKQDVATKTVSHKTSLGRAFALYFFDRKCAVETKYFDLIGCDFNYRIYLIYFEVGRDSDLSDRDFCFQLRIFDRKTKCKDTP